MLYLAYYSQLLTDSGWKSIESVEITDKLWDGIHWVSHTGIQKLGIRSVFNIDGLVTSENYEVLHPNFDYYDPAVGKLFEGSFWIKSDNISSTDLNDCYSLTINSLPVEFLTFEFTEHPFKINQSVYSISGVDYFTVATRTGALIIRE